MAEKSVKAVVEELLERVTKLENEENQSIEFYRYKVVTSINFTVSSYNSLVTTCADLSLIKDKLVTFESYISGETESSSYLTLIIGEIKIQYGDPYLQIFIINHRNASSTFYDGFTIGYIITNKELTSEEIKSLTSQYNNIDIEEV